MGKTMKILFVVMLVSLAVAYFWNHIPFIKDTIHALLDPTAGQLMNSQGLTIGLAIITAIIVVLMTLIQKYLTDQETMRQIKKDQKELQKEMQKFKDDPAKVMELQKKSFEMIPQSFEVMAPSLMYTVIPIILLFRWFRDYFVAIEPAQKVLWLFSTHSWIWAYLILSILFSSIFRKVFKVA